VAENLLFGTPVGAAFTADTIAAHPYVRQTLDSVGLTDDFIKMGREMAATMVELFADLPSDHEFFSQFSFISPDDLPEFQTLIQRIDRGGLDPLGEEDRARLLSLPFKLIPARHRLGMLDDAMQVRILNARRSFAENLPEELRVSVAFFSTAAYNAAASLQDNILFGKVAYGQADANARIGVLIAEVLDGLGLRDTVIEVGLDFNVGIAGSRLSASQRQRIGIARVLLRRPDVLVFNDAVAMLDAASQSRVVAAVLRQAKDTTVIWTTQRPEIAAAFDRVIMMQGGQLTADGTPEDLKREGNSFHAFAAGA